jgi:hypothetical protein
MSGLQKILEKSLFSVDLLAITIPEEENSQCEYDDESGSDRDHERGRYRMDTIEDPS